MHFSDSPALHPNRLVAAFQLVGWLFCHPSAWRNHVARIDPTLRPDFALVELRRAQWRNPTLRHLLVTSVCVAPLLKGVLTAMLLWAFAMPSDLIVFGVVLCVALGVALSALAGVAYGVTASAAIGVVMCLVLGGVTWLTQQPLSAWRNNEPLIVVLCIALGIVGRSAGVPEGIKLFGQTPPHAAVSRRRQMLAVTMGTLVGIVSFVAFIVTMQASSGAGREALSFGIVIALAGLFVGMASAFAVGRRRGALVGVVAIVGLPLLFVMLWLLGSALEQLLGERESGATWLVVFGALLSLYVSVLYVLSAGLTARIAGATAGGVAGALASGLGLIVAFTISEDLPWFFRNVAAGSPLDMMLWLFVTHLKWATLAWSVTLGVGATFVGLTLNTWRPILAYPFELLWNGILRRTDESGSLDHQRLQYHSAFWDEWQRLPLFGLDQHIVVVAERDPAAAQAAIEYLSTHRQRWAAQAAQIELDARQLERCADANTIANAQSQLGAGELTGPASALLRSFARISQDVDAALRQESAYNQRLALRAVEDRLDALLRELTRSDERYAIRFRPIATQWRETIAAHERAVAVAAEQRQEIDNPYVIGVPLTAQQEIFVGRANISARIEQLLLDRRRPPLLLYGQRRMGKTSLLNNLGRLLPTTIAPLFVDLQGPASWASDHAGLLYNLARGMCDSAQRQRGLVLPALARESLQADPFTRFDEWLDDVERSLGDSAALLALDEFETLDAAFDEKRFSEPAVLGMLRHIIQHRARFKVLLAGSHTLDEAQRWASYLINAQTVHIGYLTADEARTLIVQPVKDFTLRYEPDAVERVLRLTRGHPFLAQLLCAEIVARKNEQAPSERRLARLADVEAAIPDALNSGSFFFADVERNQADEAEAKLLRWMAAHGEGAVIARDDVRQWATDAADGERALRRLVRRELLERVNGGYRFQVELVRRWFARADMETR